MVVPGLEDELERINRVLPNLNQKLSVALNQKLSGMKTLTELSATGEIGFTSEVSNPI
jgi:hypothetical protein